MDLSALKGDNFMIDLNSTAQPARGQNLSGTTILIRSVLRSPGIDDTLLEK